MKNEIRKRKKTYLGPKRRRRRLLGLFSSGLPPPRRLPVLSSSPRRVVVPLSFRVAVPSPFCGSTRSHPASRCSRRWFWVLVWCPFRWRLSPRPVMPLSCPRVSSTFPSSSSSSLSSPRRPPTPPVGRRAPTITLRAGARSGVWRVVARCRHPVRVIRKMYFKIVC
jgi:hypothetical protein